MGFKKVVFEYKKIPLYLKIQGEDMICTETKAKISCSQDEACER